MYHQKYIVRGRLPEEKWDWTWISRNLFVNFIQLERVIYQQKRIFFKHAFLQFKSFHLFCFLWPLLPVSLLILIIAPTYLCPYLKHIHSIPFRTYNPVFFTEFCDSGCIFLYNRGQTHLRVNDCSVRWTMSVPIATISFYKLTSCHFPWHLISFFYGAGITTSKTRIRRKQK